LLVFGAITSVFTLPKEVKIERVPPTTEKDEIKAERATPMATRSDDHSNILSRSG